MYQRGPAHLTIVPRGFAGWFQLTAWLAVLAAHIFWFARYVDGLGRNDSMGPGLFLFCMGLVGWLICCFWWMAARAEVIDYLELQRDLKRQRQKQERARRGEGESEA